MEQLLEISVPYGIFALLFVWLLCTTSKRNECREKKYQETIDKNQKIINASQLSVKECQEIIRECQGIIFEQAKSINRMSSVSDDIKEIKGMVIKIKDRDR